MACSSRRGLPVDRHHGSPSVESHLRWWRRRAGRATGPPPGAHGAVAGDFVNPSEWFSHIHDPPPVLEDGAELRAALREWAKRLSVTAAAEQREALHSADLAHELMCVAHCGDVLTERQRVLLAPFSETDKFKPNGQFTTTRTLVEALRAARFLIATDLPGATELPDTSVGRS